MKTYQIHLIRHAVTKGNLEGRYIGHTDEPVCEEGMAQLKDIMENYGEYPQVDAVFSSPLKRCTETAKVIYPDRNPIVLDDLREYDFGEFEGKTAEELQDDPDFPEWLSGSNPNKAAPFGDSQVRFNYRICDCFEKIVDGVIKAGVGSTAVITHGGVIMSVLAAFGVPEMPMTEWLCPSACGYTMRITPSLWSKLKKVEVINEVPAEPLTAAQEERLWDYYADLPEDDEWSDEDV